MSESRTTSRRWPLPVGLVVLVVTLVVIALTRGPVNLDPDTPEGAVQEYLLAIHERRWEDAVAVIHPGWLGACEGQDLATFADPDFTAELTEGETDGFDFVPVREETESIGVDARTEDLPGPDTQIEVIISHDDSGPFGSSWNEYVVFELINEDDFWWVSGDPWPYFIWNCRT